MERSSLFCVRNSDAVLWWYSNMNFLGQKYFYDKLAMLGRLWTVSLLLAKMIAKGNCNSGKPSRDFTLHRGWEVARNNQKCEYMHFRNLDCWKGWGKRHRQNKSISVWEPKAKQTNIGYKNGASLITCQPYFEYNYLRVNTMFCRRPTS